MSYQLYPVTKSDFACDDYTVKINGVSAPLDAARVSAVPYNRRWPGYQRDISQTELINFLSLAMDEPITIEVTPKDPFEKVIIRPLDAKIPYEITKQGSILIRLDRPRYFTVEPYGRNRALHIFADPIKDYPVDMHDENVLYFGAGVHEVGNIVLKSNQTLYLDAGAVVYACIEARDAEHVRILGRGILDNSHNREVIHFAAQGEGSTAVLNATRKHTVQLDYCTDIEIDGITIRDSLVYNIRPIACKDLTIRNVKIIGCWRYNSDGIDSHNCENVLISDCFVRSYDDSFCIKGFDCWQNEEDMYHNGKVYNVAKNIRIENCVIWNDWGKCLEIGMETRAEEISNVTFDNCHIIHVTGTILDCGNVDYADIHNITYSNISIELDELQLKHALQRQDDVTYRQANPDPDPAYAPELARVEVLFHHEYSAGGQRRGKNHDLFFKNITIHGHQTPKISFKGYDESHMSRDIVFENIVWNGKRITDFNEITYSANEFCENITIK